MAFNKKQFVVLADLGFDGMYIDEYGRLIADFENEFKAFTLICDREEEGIRAWVVKHGTPKCITYRHRGGNSAQYRFRSVRQAAELAISNPHY